MFQQLISPRVVIDGLGAYTPAQVHVERSVQDSNVSPHPVIIWPLWLRIGASSLFFVDAILNMWKGFLQFQWVPWLCIGLYCLLYAPRQRGERFSAYLRRPLGIASVALLIGALIGFVHNLSVLYTKHYH